jgi:hypothetical protein
MAATYDSRVIWDRLALLLLVQPREGWEREFEKITRREIERLAPAATEAERERDEQCSHCLRAQRGYYTNELAPEAEIAAAVEVARGDYNPEGAAA